MREYRHVATGRYPMIMNVLTTDNGELDVYEKDSIEYVDTEVWLDGRSDALEADGSYYTGEPCAYSIPVETLLPVLRNVEGQSVYHGGDMYAHTIAVEMDADLNNGTIAIHDNPRLGPGMDVHGDIMDIQLAAEEEANIQKFKHEDAFDARVIQGKEHSQWAHRHPGVSGEFERVPLICVRDSQGRSSIWLNRQPEAAAMIENIPEETGAFKWVATRNNYSVDGGDWYKVTQAANDNLDIVYPVIDKHGDYGRDPEIVASVIATVRFSGGNMHVDFNSLEQGPVIKDLESMHQVQYESRRRGEDLAYEYLDNDKNYGKIITDSTPRIMRTQYDMDHMAKPNDAAYQTAQSYTNAALDMARIRRINSVKDAAGATAQRQQEYYGREI